MKIIGIDPAPTKKSTVYDGETFKDYDFQELQNYLAELHQSIDDVLICWDAPLSFGLGCKIPFLCQHIEKFFSSKDGYVTPYGILAKRDYTCSHEMISQYIESIRENRIEVKSSIPFNLVFNNSTLMGKKSMTEVRPSVAIWLWCKQYTTRKNWAYKKDTKVFDALIDILVNKEIIPKDTASDIDNDNKLDAYIAWKLGELWVKNNEQVVILGDNKTGSLLLPKNENVIRKFNNFKEQKTTVTI